MPKHSGHVVTAEENGGVEKIFHRLHDGGWAYEARQDCQPIADANAEARNHLSTWSPSKEWKHVARIPPVWVLKFLNEKGIDVFNPEHDAEVNRLLDDPEYRWMRTDESVLSKRGPSKRQIEARVAAQALREAV